jgi:hypothetical protein
MKHVDSLGMAGSVEWTGRSGRHYWLLPSTPSDLHVADDSICLLTAMTEGGEKVVWSGTAQTLIAEPASRNLFRAALKRAATGYSMRAPSDEVDRMTILWDLESASRLSVASAA